jgi:hypothetical protein
MRHPIQLPNYMGCLKEFYTSLTLFLYKQEFQNPQIFQQTISLFPEQSTLVLRHENIFKGPLKSLQFFLSVNKVARFDSHQNLRNYLPTLHDQP